MSQAQPSHGGRIPPKNTLCSDMREEAPITKAAVGQGQSASVTGRVRTVGWHGVDSAATAVLHRRCSTMYNASQPLPPAHQHNG